MEERLPRWYELSRQERVAVRQDIRITRERKFLEPYGDSGQFEALINASKPNQLVSEIQSHFAKQLYIRINEGYNVAHQPPRPMYREDFSMLQREIGRFSHIITLLASPDPAHGLDRFLLYLKRRGL